MNYYDYDLTNADECIRLVSDIADEYNRIYRELSSSFSDIPEMWSGEAAVSLQKKCEEMLSEMELSCRDFDELVRQTSDKGKKLRTMENNVLKSITGW